MPEDEFGTFMTHLERLDKFQLLRAQCRVAVLVDRFDLPARDEHGSGDKTIPPPPCFEEDFEEVDIDNEFDKLIVTEV